MKRALIIALFFIATRGQAQDSLGYTDLLQSVKEIQLGDSLHIDLLHSRHEALDSNSMKQWFFPMLGGTNNNRLKNRAYYLNGKITSNPNFNLLVILEEKKKNDTLTSQVVYLVTTRMNGTYIASLKAAISGNKKRSSYNTSSWLYSDYKVVMDSKMVINDKSYYDLSNYRINRTGRFILYPNY